MLSLKNPIVKNLLSTLTSDAKKKGLKGYVLFFDKDGEPQTAELKKDENVYSTPDIEKIYSLYEKTVKENRELKEKIKTLELLTKN